ncbi:hypothetical protein [Rhodohalobacter sulfatireducens]|uniref:DUF1440 domain-containing protein n=1 Tax=Rhodohalobacter sulfatireducens TaxID=2911366 RepID=A0ABS9KEF5_9BACT|nr:hypothetical protein [Rhodohalobacter sulfatireducens]MCG2589242.1 hypothetical protein [Rhodohalobacter sulfatireducens]
MKWIKVILIGMAATFSMDVVMKTAMYLLSIAPTNIHPAAAFLYNLGIEQSLFSSLVHYSYGTLWAFVFLYAFEYEVSVKRGLQLAVALWFFMMLVYSPIIGWGFFGIGNAELLSPGHPLYLSSTIEYLFITLLVHLAYGTVLGMLSRKLIVRN